MKTIHPEPQTPCSNLRKTRRNVFQNRKILFQNQTLMRHLLCLLLLQKFFVNGQYFGSNEVVNCNEVFSIEEHRNGTLQTLGYPEPYPERRFCNIQLMGNDKNRVIIKFEDFYLFHPLGKNHRKHAGCNGLDTLGIYDGSNDASKLIGEYCGGHKPPFPMMSSGPHLLLRLTSYTSGLEARGFSANFEFVSNFGIDSGVQKGPGICEFLFDSMVKKSGKITSPNPGGIYPSNTNCTYIFDGTFLERIFLKFQYFELEGIEPCTVRSGSDFLEFSNVPGVDPCPARRCGRFIPQEVVSDGPYFRIVFHSNERLNGLGFAASYKFVTDEKLPEWASYLRSCAGFSKHASLRDLRDVVVSSLSLVILWLHSLITPF